MTEKIEQKKYVIQLKINENLDYRETAIRANKNFNTDYWDGERVRDVMRKFRRKENEKRIGVSEGNCESNLQSKEDSKYKLQEDKINQKIQELQKERIRVQTEKIELNNLLRQQVRADMTEDKIVDALKNKLKDIYVSNIKPIQRKKNDISTLVALADMHYGVEFEILDLIGNVLNKYSPEIFEQRMWTILNDIVIYANKNNINEVTILNLGDELEGIIHVSQLMSLRYGAIESVILLSDFLVKWILTLAQYLRVNYKQVQGNHTESRILTGKKGDFPHENLSKIIIWHLRSVMESKNVPNISIQEYNAEGNVYFNLSGYDILAVHGHNESNNLIKSLNDYTMLYNKNNIDYLMAGHLHMGLSADACKDKEVVRFPSIMGGNEYSLSIKKMSNAGTKIILFEKDKGITDEHRILLK